ncbi:hypothetical protein DQ239_15910 [Blastococcus sp. TF02-09]|uniref:hypothetical protein n=1 Tax=Blastococcus sp. TF02-09 TaxID=2250576 RepID=UPI000DE926E3|nr:hypothetical protein [Blastococcus sp. TF02-9]RBY75572.1 hypothetical protein DQ239_15910 [Blastococcus sp. TF02-9]
MSRGRTTSDRAAAAVTANLASRPYRVSPPVVLTAAELAARGGVLPVWADPMAMADETEVDRLQERRLYAGLAAAIAVVVLLWTVRALVM